MKKLNAFVLIAFAVFAAVPCASAGDKMIIQFKNGTQQSIDVQDIHSIVFQSDATQPAAAATGIVSGQTYRLVAKHSGRCMDVAGAGRGNAANVYQWDCHGGGNQMWKFTDRGQGYYSLTAMHSGRCLDVQGGGRDKGANVYQWDCHGGDNQSWSFIPQGGGYYMAVAKHSGKCLDVEGAGKGNQANIYQWDCHGGDNQLWRLQ